MDHRHKGENCIHTQPLGKKVIEENIYIMLGKNVFKYKLKSTMS